MFGHEWHGVAGMRQRMMEKGQFKYIMLDMLKDKPAHGYELIRSLEEKLGGSYTPSPGVVYPTLQMLEDQGYVRSQQQDGRKVYEITVEGRQFLEENRAKLELIIVRMQDWSKLHNWDEVAPIVVEMRELIPLLVRWRKGEAASSDKTRRIHEVLEKARKDIAAILAE